MCFSPKSKVDPAATEDPQRWSSVAFSGLVSENGVLASVASTERIIDKEIAWN